jgi:hypothetical protein
MSGSVLEQPGAIPCIVPFNGSGGVQEGAMLRADGTWMDASADPRRTLGVYVAGPEGPNRIKLSSLPRRATVFIAQRHESMLGIVRTTSRDENGPRETWTVAARVDNGRVVQPDDRVIEGQDPRPARDVSDLTLGDLYGIDLEYIVVVPDVDTPEYQQLSAVGGLGSTDVRSRFAARWALPDPISQRPVATATNAGRRNRTPKTTELREQLPLRPLPGNATPAPAPQTSPVGRPRTARQWNGLLGQQELFGKLDPRWNVPSPVFGAKHMGEYMVTTAEQDPQTGRKYFQSKERTAKFGSESPLIGLMNKAFAEVSRAGRPGHVVLATVDPENADLSVLSYGMPQTRALDASGRRTDIIVSFTGSHDEIADFYEAIAANPELIEDALRDGPFGELFARASIVRDPVQRLYFSDSRDFSTGSASAALGPVQSLDLADPTPECFGPGSLRAGCGLQDLA